MFKEVNERFVLVDVVIVVIIKLMVVIEMMWCRTRRLTWRSTRRLTGKWPTLSEEFEGPYWRKALCM